MKKIIALILTMAVFLTLAACGKTNDGRNPSMNIDEIKNDDGTTSLVKNGTETYYISVGKNETCEIEMSFNNQSGSINAYIAKDGVRDNAIYTGTDIQSGTFSVTASESGEYQICYEASDYIGEYTYSTAVK